MHIKNVKRFQLPRLVALSFSCLLFGSGCGAPGSEAAPEESLNANTAGDGLNRGPLNDPALSDPNGPGLNDPNNPGAAGSDDSGVPLVGGEGDRPDAQLPGGESDLGSEALAEVAGFCKSFANGSGSTQPCYVADDGAAYCIADDGSTTKLGGSGTAVSASGQNFTSAACVVNDSGAVSCGQYATMTEQIASGATQVSGAQNGWCALVEGGLSCQGAQPPAIMGTVDQIACFYAGCCAKTTAGAMHCWGTQAFGSTTEVPLPTGKKALQLGPGQDHICAVLDGGQVQCWGQDWNKQLGGLGADSMAGKTLAESGAVSVVGGQFHTCIAFEDGHVECTSQGQTEGAGLDAGSLTQVEGIDSAIALSAGKHYSCALLSDRSIKCWGRIGGGKTPISVSGPAVAACN